MAATGDIDRQRAAAWLVVVAVHAGLGWLLLRAAMVRLPGGEDDAALQLVWIESPAPRAQVAPPAAHAPPPRAGRRSAVAARPAPRAAEPGPVPARPPPSRGLSAIFIEQARAAPIEAPGADPFADRVARLPGREANTFRMREPRSIERTLQKVGALFGGAGYTTDPCPRIHENVAALANGEGRERELLQEELRRQRAYCH